MDGEFIQLPNKDLWKGYKEQPTEQAKLESEVIPAEMQNPVNRAMAAILEASKGGIPTCLWCGQQYDERSMREHLKTSHPSVMAPINEAAVLMATVEQLKANAAS